MNSCCICHKFQQTEVEWRLPCSFSHTNDTFCKTPEHILTATGIWCLLRCYFNKAQIKNKNSSLLLTCWTLCQLTLYVSIFLTTYFMPKSLHFVRVCICFVQMHPFSLQHSWVHRYFTNRCGACGQNTRDKALFKQECKALAENLMWTNQKQTVKKTSSNRNMANRQKCVINVYLNLSRCFLRTVSWCSPIRCLQDI